MTDASRLPMTFRGRVVRGFGRGGRELNCPTANLDIDAVLKVAPLLATGVYMGFAKVDHGDVHLMVMSVGENIQFGMDKKTVEVHLLHDFDKDFYGSLVSAVATHFIRPMLSFRSVEELKQRIDADKEQARQTLTSAELSKWLENPIFTDIPN